MDETTEPIIAVIGHPIAGNPTQFALEVGLQAAQVDCRVLSIDIEDDRVRDAVVGMNAMDFAGIWVADTSRDAVERWLAETDRGGKWIDFLKRQSASETQEIIWEPFVLKAQAWPELVAQALPASSIKFGKILFIDRSFDTIENDLSEQTSHWIQWFKNTGVTGLGELTEEQLGFQNKLPTTEELNSHLECLPPEDSLLVIVNEDEQSDLSDFKCISLPPRAVMVDLNENSDPAIIAAADQLKATSQGSFIRAVDVHAKCLSKIIAQLFNREVPIEVLQEAIVEYIAV